MDFTNKWNMTKKENIFVAKRNIIDYIWKSANLEGIGVTYPDTETICDGMTVDGYTIKDTLAVNNLKHAWMFVLDNIDYPMDYSFICKVNQIIGGTNWQPDLPDEDEIKEQLNFVLSIEKPLERAVNLMLYCVRKQMFLDGNKRTSMLVANQIMIANGCGIISVPLEKQRAFIDLLVSFYTSNNIEDIAKFILDECIDGIDFRTQEMNQSIEKDVTNHFSTPTQSRDDDEDMEL
ncbi:MAG: Fic family protein [Clostridiales bacterium]